MKNLLDGTFALFRKAENGLAFIFIILMTLVSLAEMLVRGIFKSGVPGTFGNLSQTLLVLALLAGMIAARGGEHLNIALVNFVPKGRARTVLAAVSATVSVVILTMLALSSLTFVAVGLSGAKLRGFLPDQTLAWLMPFAFAVMAFRLSLIERSDGRKSRLPLLGILLGALLAFPAAAQLVWGFDLPSWAQGLANGVYDLYARFGIAAVLFLVLAAFTGAPLFVVLAAVALFFIGRSGGELLVVPNQIYTQLINTSLPAIPLFTVVGFLLSESKAGERLVRVFRSLFGWVPGGIIIATTVACAFFTTFTGASGVTILALGGLLSKILLDAKYPKTFVYGLLTAVGSIGILFPPSLPIILVGVSTGTSVLKMFAGGFLPGVLLIVAMSVFGIFSALRHHVPVEPFSLRETAKNLKDSVWEILLPFILVVGYFSGLLSIVETAAFSVLYAVVIEVFVNKDIALRDLAKVFLKAVPIIGGVLAIIAASQALSYYIVDAEIPQLLTTWVRSFVTSPVVFLLLLNVVLIVAGAFMEIYASIIVILPLLGPLGEAYGIGPVHLGIIFLVNMEVAFLFPPVGLNILLATYRFKAPFIEVVRSVLPFLLIQIFVVLVVCYVPWLTTALANLF